MTDEVDQAAFQIPLFIPDSDHADFGIDGTCRFDDVRIAGAWMSICDSVSHQEPAIKGDLFLNAHTSATLGSTPFLVGFTDRFN